MQPGLELYQTWMENSLDGLHVMDEQGNIVDANQTFCDMLGYTREEVLKLNVADWNAEWSREELHKRFKNGRGTKLRFETTHRKKDGSLISVEVNSANVDIKGRHYYFASCRDISERRKIEALLLESERLYRELFNDSTVAMYRTRLDNGEILNANDKFLELLGRSREEIIGMTSTQTWAFPHEREEMVRRVKAEGHVENFEHHILHKDGRILNCISSLHLHPEKKILIGSVIDITAIKNTEHERRVAAVAFESQEGMVITDAHANIVRVNKAFTAITGYSNDEAIGKNPRILSSGRQSRGFYERMWQIINATGSWKGEIWNRRKNGEIYPEYLSISAVRDATGAVINYIGTMQDITLRKETEDRIMQLAFYDHLTGLPNRRLFRDRLELDMKRAARNKSSLALLLIDLDRFKEVNDTLGHDKGDRLLVEATRRIRQHVREADTFARLGGDEFIIILPEYGDPSNIDRIAQNILTEIGTPFDLGDKETGNISCSIGITLFPQDGGSVEELLKNADQAMYSAKYAGRNGFNYFTHRMRHETIEKNRFLDELRLAVSRDELEVYYQPIVNSKTSRIEKAEALLRWNNPERGMVSPADFIPLAEEFGLIHDIGNWVFSRVADDIQDWQARLGKEIQISVNRSPVEFAREKFNWIEVLNTRSLPGKAVTMEITEGLLLSESEHVKQTFVDCRNSGIEVSIDDFGTGYSALSYLRQFDIDYLKVDQSFVRNITENESNRALAEAIIVLAHKLGIKTIAEGVETEAQKAMLVSFGCDYLQGYLYSRPVPPAAFEMLLTKQQA